MIELEVSVIRNTTYFHACSVRLLACLIVCFAGRGAGVGGGGAGEGGGGGAPGHCFR